MALPDVQRSCPSVARVHQRCVLCRSVCWPVAIAIVLAYGHHAVANETNPRPDTRRIQFTLEVSNHLLDGNQADPDGFSPGRNIAIAPPASRWTKGVRGEEWLKRHAPFLEEQNHTFQIREGAVVPPFSIARVGDSVRLITPDQRELKLQIPGAMGGYVTGSRTVPTYTLRDPSAGFVALMVASRPNGGVEDDHVQPAYVIVSDHGYGRITDDAGIALFDAWPKESELEVELLCPFIRKHFSLKSATARFREPNRLVVPAGTESETHVIQVVPLKMFF